MNKHVDLFEVNVFIFQLAPNILGMIPDQGIFIFVINEHASCFHQFPRRLGSLGATMPKTVPKFLLLGHFGIFGETFSIPKKFKVHFFYGNCVT